jgi:hypothetical protein
LCDEPDEYGFDRPPRYRPRARSHTGLVVGLIAGGAGLLVVLGVVLAVVLVNKSSIPEGDWKEFSPPGGGYSILMPGHPSLNNMALQGAPGSKYLLLRDGGRWAFTVAHIDIPPALDNAGTLDMMANGEKQVIIQATRGKVIGQRNITLGQHPGREFQVEAADGGVLIERLYVVRQPTGTRLYLVAVGGPGIRPETGDGAKFLGSFRLLGS